MVILHLNLAFLLNGNLMMTVRNLCKCSLQLAWSKFKVTANLSPLSFVVYSNNKTQSVRHASNVSKQNMTEIKTKNINISSKNCESRRPIMFPFLPLLSPCFNLLKKVVPIKGVKELEGRG